jgi:hypothetical protein
VLQQGAYIFISKLREVSVEITNPAKFSGSEQAHDFVGLSHESRPS